MEVKLVVGKGKRDCYYRKSRWLGGELYHFCGLSETSCVLNGSLECLVPDSLKSLGQVPEEEDIEGTELAPEEIQEEEEGDNDKLSKAQWDSVRRY